jgi:hypothetical protein
VPHSPPHELQAPPVEEEPGLSGLSPIEPSTEPMVGAAEEPPSPADSPGPVAAGFPHAETPAEAVFREALELMDDLGGVRVAMALLAEHGQAPDAAASSSRPTPDPASRDSSPAPSPDPAPYSGGAPSGAAGAASSSSGSAGLYALVVALATLAAGLWGRLQVVPVHWRSVALVALNERPG